MNGKKPDEQPSAESLSRANRQRLARDEGVRAMAEAEKQAVEIRKNMQRLRALREAREADEAASGAVAPPPTKKKRKTRVAS